MLLPILFVLIEWEKLVMDIKGGGGIIQIAYWCCTKLMQDAMEELQEKWKGLLHRF